MLEEYKDEIIKFLSQHKSSSIKSATTLREGCVVFISPIPTICGPEIMCHPNTKPFLVDFINSSKG